MGSRNIRQMDYRIEGELAQVAHLEFMHGEACWASKGSILQIDLDLQWQLKVPGDLAAVGSRMLSGEGIAMTYFEGTRTGQKVSLTANQPGKIMPWDLVNDGPVVTTRGSFVAAWGEAVNIEVTMAKRAGAAFFGGAGLFLQKVSGTGTALIHGAGDFVERNLAPDEEMLVSTGNLAAFAQSVDYNIRGVAGCRKMIFGGEGLFMVHLTGPGRVLLQSMKRVTPGQQGSHR